MNYDLHIHSGLSPCANDEMSPNNILQMAKLLQLKLVSVTDHNSFAQQEVLCKLAPRYGLNYWFGIELTTREEVHLLAYFGDIDDAKRLQKRIDESLLSIPNSVDYYGHQWIYDEEDNPKQDYPKLLITSVDLTLKECIDLIHRFHGKAVLAHIYGRANGIVEQLGFIPENLDIDGIEVKHDSEIDRFRDEYPQLHHLPILINSDAHQLRDMVKTHYPLPTLAHWFKAKL